MSYKIINVVLNGTTPTEVFIDGAYIRIIESVGDLTLAVDNSNSGFIQKGIGVSVPEGFKSLAFSGDAQVIRVAVSDVKIDDSRFSLDGPVSIQAGILSDSVAVGMTAVDTVVQAIPAATNQNGLRIYGMHFLVTAAGGLFRIAYSDVVPFSVFDVNVPGTLMVHNGNDGKSDVGLPITIPPGNAVYVLNAGGSFQAYINYEVL